MKEQGRVKYTPPYEVGGYDNVYDAHPPILFQIAAPVSIMTGIETYDTVLFTAVFLLLLGALVMYCIIRVHSTSVALLALPVTLLMLGGKSLIALKWGYWLFIAGVFFMLAAFWMLSKRDVKHSWVLLGLLLGATAVAHIPEFVFLGIFMALMLLWEVYTHKKLPIATLKTFIIAGVLAVILAALSINLFIATFAKTEGYRGVTDTQLGSTGMTLIDLGWVGFIIAGGAILFILSRKKNSMPAEIAIFLFVMSYLNLIGLGKRAATHRWFWYIYLAFFFGFAVYFALSFIKKEWRTYVVLGASLLLMAGFSYAVYVPSEKQGPGVMDPYNWEAFTWIQKNIPEDAQIFYWYGDALQQGAVLYNTRRVGYKINPEYIGSAVEKKRVERVYAFGLADSYAAYLCDATPFSYGYYTVNPKTDNATCTKGSSGITPSVPYERDICDNEYHYFNAQSSQSQFSQYGLIVRQALLEGNMSEEIYRNDLVSIIKLKQRGVDCIGNITLSTA